MNLNRANEKHLESHGTPSAEPGSVLDVRADRLGRALTEMRANILEAQRTQSLESGYGPPAPDRVVALNSLVADLASQAQHSKSAQADVTAAAENFNAAWGGKITTHLGEAAQKSATALQSAAFVANMHFGGGTFYGISADACKADAKLDRFCDRAHALVKAGYIGEKELQGVKVALTDSHSVSAQFAAAIYDIKENGYSSVMPGKQESKSSHFQAAESASAGATKSDNKIVVSADQVKDFLPSRKESAVEVFTHELGHFLSKDKLMTVVADGITSLKEKGLPMGDHAAELMPMTKEQAQQRTSNVNFKDGVGGILGQEISSTVKGHSRLPAHRWDALAGEMYADLTSIAGQNAEFGKAAALTLAAEFAVARENGLTRAIENRIAHLQPSGETEKIRFGEGHHTTQAVADFAQKIRSGELDKVHTPAQLDRLIGESVAQGLAKEYAMVRAGEINAHSIHNGKIQAGLPQGISEQSVLAAEAKGGAISARAGQPTFFLTPSEAGGVKKEALLGGISVKTDTGELKHLVVASEPPRQFKYEKPAFNTEKVQGRDIPALAAPFVKASNATLREFPEISGHLRAEAALVTLSGKAEAFAKEVSSGLKAFPHDASTFLAVAKKELGIGFGQIGDDIKQVMGKVDITSGGFDKVVKEVGSQQQKTHAPAEAKQNEAPARSM